MFTWFSSGSIRFYSVFAWFHLVLLGFTWLYRVLPSFTGFQTKNQVGTSFCAIVSFSYLFKNNSIQSLLNVGKSLLRNTPPVICGQLFRNSSPIDSAVVRAFEKLQILEKSYRYNSHQSRSLANKIYILIQAKLGENEPNPSPICAIKTNKEIISVCISISSLSLR